MATGYTYPVKDGKVTEFASFALSCARAFGALVTIRDDSSDAPIPEKFEPSQWAALEVAKDRSELLRIEALTHDEAASEAQRAHDEEMRRWRERGDDRHATRIRYAAMLDQVFKWEPPSPEHAGLKEFMADQLKTSIDHDCSDHYDALPEWRSGDKWRADQIAMLRWAITRMSESQADEEKRVADRNRWVQQLRDSLIATTAAK